MIPGPDSTQTVAAIAYKQGGTKLAVLSALIWLLPPAALMTAAALLISSLSPDIGFARLFRFIEPMAVGFVCYAAVLLAEKIIKTPFSVAVALVAALTTIIFKSPRSEEHTSELQSLMRISYAVFCLKKKIQLMHV